MTNETQIAHIACLTCQKINVNLSLEVGANCLARAMLVGQAGNFWDASHTETLSIPKKPLMAMP